MRWVMGVGLCIAGAWLAVKAAEHMGAAFFVRHGR
jgi:hypothetical protein